MVTTPAPATRGAEPFDDVVRAVTARYLARAARYYVGAKLRMDVVARTVWQLGTEEHLGAVADVGCGRGQLGLLLLVSRVADALTGVDWDVAKVRIAADAAHDLASARFEHGDVRTFAIEPVDTVLLVDVLHYLTHEEQDDLLVRAARAARQRVLVRDLDPERGAASVLTRWLERIGAAFGYNRAEAELHPRAFDEIAALLELEGFTVTRDDCSASGLSNVLLVARRRAAAPHSSLL